MLLTFANVERRLDPASQKPTAAQALALPLLWLCSFCGPLGSGSPLSVCPSDVAWVSRRFVHRCLSRVHCRCRCCFSLFLLLFPSFSFCSSFRYCLTAGHGALKLVFRLWLPLHSQHVRALIICTRLLSLPLSLSLSVSVCVLFSWPARAYCLMNDCSCQSSPATCAFINCEA